MDNKVSNKQTLFTDAEITKFKLLFGSHDVDKDGRISSDELLKLTEEMGPTPTQEEVRSVIESFDTNTDGTLDFDEFLTLMANLRAMGRE
ncbi:hypothetical protein BGZ94_008987 [Podila epigama]|nr:hypothetical protein BGZ94_008987 [Podila epigama]